MKKKLPYRPAAAVMLLGALRELEEETGIPPHLVDILGRTPDVLLYDLPAELKGKIWGGKFRGQAQHWFVARFLGSDEDINLDTPRPEFRDWKWVESSELVSLIVPFKRRLYEQVVEAFAEFLT